MRLANIAFAAVLCLFLARAGLSQVTKSVDCNKGKSITSTVSKLDADKEYIVEVSGTCNENVVVEDFEGISLQIVGTPSAIINGQNASPPMPAFSVLNSRRVRVANLTINTTPFSATGNSGGLQMIVCRGCVADTVSINGDRAGFLFIQSQGSLLNSTVNLVGPGTATAIANSSDVTVVNYQAVGNLSPLSFAGINVDAASRVRLSYSTPKQIRNFINGIRVANASSIEGGGICGSPPGQTSCLEIRDSNYGIRITSAQATVMAGVNFTNNGTGVWAENGSNATLGPLINITGSTAAGGSAGNGITITHNSHGSLVAFTPGGGSANNITGNVRRGVSIASNSSFQFSGLSGSEMNNVTGNLSPDVACDATSLVTGTNTLPIAPGPASVISCVNQDPAPTPLP